MWVQRIKYLISIQSILQRTPTAHLYVPLLDVFQRISTLPGNNLCADCGERDPSVASLAYAVMLCEECGVVHARMGRRVQRFKVPNAQNAKCLIFVEHVMRGVEGNVNASPDLIKHWHRMQVDWIERDTFMQSIKVNQFNI